MTMLKLSPKNAQAAYLLGSVVTGIVGIAVLFGAVDQGTADNLGQALLGLLGLLGAGAPALAAKRVSEQRKDGTFDPAPANPVLDAFESINAIKNRVDEAVNQSTAKVNEGIAIIQGASAMIPGVGGLTNVVLSGPVGDLIQAMTDHGDGR